MSTTRRANSLHTQTDLEDNADPSAYPFIDRIGTAEPIPNVLFARRWTTRVVCAMKNINGTVMCMIDNQL